MNKSHFIAFFCWLSVLGIYAQPENLSLSQDFGALFKHAEAVYGPDDLLVNGAAYRPAHLMAANHPYYLSSEWHSGMVVSNAKVFKNEDIKFNIFSHELIMLATGKSGAVSIIVLNPKLVDAFELGGHYFMNVSRLLKEQNTQPFFEIIYDGNFAFLASHKKVFNPHYTDRTPYGIFSKENKTYYVLQEGEMLKISSKRAFLKHFEGIKPLIRKFMRLHKIRYKKASNPQLNQLMKYCDDELSSQ